MAGREMIVTTVLAWVVLRGGLAFAESAAPNIVSTSSGLISGVPFLQPTAGIRFLGIPYAMPPTGERRWTPPAALIPWSGVRSADVFGAACPQGPKSRSTYTWLASMMATLPGREYFKNLRFDEDCLYLNVWTPSIAPATRAPVVVYVHGGGNVESSGQSSSFGHAFVAHGVVLVSFNYRLGALGFMAHPALSEESAKHVSGNYGLLDILAALQWVRANIRAFGGDPDRVTVMGESAGAASIYELTTSPLAAGLFHQAIIESSGIGVFVQPELRGHVPMDGGTESAEEDGLRLAHDLGADGPEALRRLRSLPPEQILDAARNDGDLNTLAPIVDGWVLPEQPAAVYRAGAQLRIPILIGSNANESTMFLSGMPKTAAGYRDTVESGFHDAWSLIYALHPAESDAEAPAAVEAYVEGMVFASNYIPMAAMRRIGVPACYYRFTYKAKGRDAALGAYHSLEIGILNKFFVEGDWGAPSEGDLEFADALLGIWSRFIATGDPNGGGLPRWNCRGPATNEVYELGERFGSTSTLPLREVHAVEAALAMNLARAAKSHQH